MISVFALPLVPVNNAVLTVVKTNAHTLVLATSTVRRTCASAILPNAAVFAAPKERFATPKLELAAIRSAPAASVARMAADMNVAVVTRTNCVSMENVSVSRIARELNAAQTVAAMCADIATSASVVTMGPVATCNATAGNAAQTAVAGPVEAAATMRPVTITQASASAPMMSVAGVAALPARCAMRVNAVHLRAAAVFTTPITVTTTTVEAPVTAPKPTGPGRFATPISNVPAPHPLILAGR